jgi:hypothetical protein
MGVVAGASTPAPRDRAAAVAGFRVPGVAMGVASDQAGRARRGGRMNQRSESLPDPDVAGIVRENRKKHRFKRLLDP